MLEADGGAQGDAAPRMRSEQQAGREGGSSVAGVHGLPQRHRTDSSAKQAPNGGANGADGDPDTQALGFGAIASEEVKTKARQRPARDEARYEPNARTDHGSCAG